MHSLCRHARCAAVLVIALAACDRLGIDHSASGASANEFRVLSVDLDPSGFSQLNRRIRFEFNDRIDFASVNSNSIAIRAWNGVPAVGEFCAVDGNARAIDFQPRCPHNLDLSDAGLTLATSYTIDLRGADQGVFDGVRSTSGARLKYSTHRVFTTPWRSANAFYDTRAGAPHLLVRETHSGAADTSYIELGGDTTSRVYFERDPHGNLSIDPELELPLALHSEPDSRVVFFLALDQSIDVSPVNIARIALEFRGDSGAWHALPAASELVENCTANGAIVRLQPLGSLPPSSDLRVVLRTGLSDLVGQALDVDVVELALLRTQAAPQSLRDEILEDFATSELEDADATFAEPRALWRDGKLEMNHNFAGIGGPGGDFDLLVATGTQLVFDTTHMTLVGGPGFASQCEQIAVAGVLDVRNLTIAAGATLRAQGPNPLVILASGDVQIDGVLDVSGVSHLGVVQGGSGTYGGPGDAIGDQGGGPAWLWTRPGALGQAGGGNGGDSHPALGDVSPPFGGVGYGAFHAASMGGHGGETGWTTNSAEDSRRGAGGGGGRFGPDVLNSTGASGAFDQRRIGLDAEAGFNNTHGSNGAINTGAPPQGGAIGSAPFADGDPSNDFFGVAVDEVTNERVVGELIKPWAGAGGGGGGDAVRILSGGGWPDAHATNSAFGGGGGGGGGSLRIIALGHIRFGAAGQIVARGGAGGGGNNTLFLNRVGGAGGGGSGGHVILESASTIEFAANLQNQPSVLATGGQGGPGAQNVGGPTIGSSGYVETTPTNDACPAGYSTTGVNPCKGPIDGAGGDGGPGVIQLHLFHGIDDVVLPPGKSLADVCQPPPLCDWGTRHLQPSVELRSRSRSKWIPVGLGGFDATSDLIAPSEFEFIGTDAATGNVLATNGEVDLAPPILGPSVLGHAPSAPYIDHSGIEIVFDAGEWTGANLAYLLERPHLLRRAIVELRSVDSPALHERFDIVSALRIDNTSLLALSIDGNGPLFDGFQPGGAVEASLHPTWLRAASNGELDSLPDSAAIRIAFQATTADANGLPDESAATAPLYDVNTLNDYAAHNPLRFVRFDVLLIGGPSGDPSVVNQFKPSLDFLRLPWRWRDD